MKTHNRNPWELQDTERTLSEIVRRGRARAGVTLIACIDNESQEVREVRKVMTPTPYRGDDDEDEYWAMDSLRGEVLAIAQEIAPERTRDGGHWSPMVGTFVTVVCREGRAVSTDVEWQFLPAWRYSNHFTAAFQGDIFVVTPHGWTSTLSEASGHEPALRSTPAVSLVPDLQN
ncbi:hypothetical protein NF556_17720 [Ornithinimicrobium faecis]|uniref:Uncharacterized protein n=1 Tax=Ornithinimicrobium faecis TaxID=2934158 RepID=A0ABY4YRM6_9MICO|nr:hypothetical protein [Ornithinimicrobium sp. HY1793]USQ79420.1 hypothetical protein NF556_17720 [Ornithinimicrobium sp. HY1793]